MKIMILGDFSKSILMKFGLISLYISVSIVSITELEGSKSNLKGENGSLASNKI